MVSKVRLQSNLVEDELELLLDVPHAEFSEVQVRLSDANGRLWKNWQTLRSRVLVLGDLPQGMYFLQVQMDGVQEVLKFLKK